MMTGYLRPILVMVSAICVTALTWACGVEAGGGGGDGDGGGGGTDGSVVVDLCDREVDCGLIGENEHDHCVDTLNDDLDAASDIAPDCGAATSELYGCAADMECNADFIAECGQELDATEDACEVENGGNGPNSNSGPATIAEEVCDRDLNCGNITSGQYDQCINDINVARNDAQATSTECGSSIDGYLGCVAQQPCGANPDAQCSAELDAVEADCDDGGGVGPSTTAHDYCDRELDCGHITSGEHEQCVSETDLYLDIAQDDGPACHDALVEVYQCMTAQPCGADMDTQCSAEFDALDATCSF